jgi:hypothetical protein
MLIPLSSVLVEPPPKRPCQEIRALLDHQWDNLCRRQGGKTEDVNWLTLSCQWKARALHGCRRVRQIHSEEKGCLGTYEEGNRGTLEEQVPI